jgi:hypothetical protein
MCPLPYTALRSECKAKVPAVLHAKVLATRAKRLATHAPTITVRHGTARQGIQELVEVFGVATTNLNYRQLRLSIWHEQARVVSSARFLRRTESSPRVSRYRGYRMTHV